jgi:hypothetical protein
MEIFDKYGKFVMPSADEIAALDTPTQERFAAVQTAATELETVTANRVAAEQAVKAAITERDESEKALRILRPKLDPVAVAKEMIAFSRSQ